MQRLNLHKRALEPSEQKFGEGRRYDRERRNAAALRFPHRSRDLNGLGLALTEEISIDDGAVQQSNFYDYTVMRMSDVPEIYVELIASDEHPSGVGQMPVTVVAPAIGNAVSRLTNVRLRETPMTAERVKKALG